LAIALLMLSTLAFGVDISPDEIQKKVVDSYRALDTYKAEGTIISDMGSDGTQHKLETSFTILLKKPNLYLITWTQSHKFTPGLKAQSGAVWSDGTQPYLYMSAMHAYSKMTSDDMALGTATGISGGAAFTVPSLFLHGFMGQPRPFSRLKELEMEETGKVGKEECFVLSGSSSISKKETYWLSKSSYLIRHYSRSLETPEGGMVVPELTDEALEQAIIAMGQKVTPETMKTIKEMMEKTSASLKTTKLTGSTTESHVKVSFPALSKSDFKFALPEGTVLKDSLFEGMLKASKTLADRTKDTP
jgi:outer membrane lipoprotein-sorting protein